MENVTNRMTRKGWDEEKINQLNYVLYHKRIHFLRPQTLAKLVFWCALLLCIAGNLIVAVALVPAFWVIPDWALFFILILVGLCFGALFDILIKDIELLDPKHHIIGGLFLPVMGIIFMYIMVDLSNKFSSIANIPLFVEHSAIFVSLVYIIAFMAPYGWTMRRIYLRNT